MEWITLFLVALGIGFLILEQGAVMALLGLVSVLIGLMVGYFDIIKEATE